MTEEVAFLVWVVLFCALLFVIYQLHSLWGVTTILRKALSRSEREYQRRRKARQTPGGGGQ